MVTQTHLNASGGRRLIEPNIEKLPKDWGYTPVKEKAAFLQNWQKTPKSLDDVKTYLPTQATGIGLLTGPLTGILAIDIDGPKARDWLDNHLKKYGMGADALVNSTFSVTSGKEGRSQSFFKVTNRGYRKYLATKKIQVAGEYLEIRWDGCQSVIYGAHPETGSYKWLSEPENIKEAPPCILWLSCDFKKAITKKEHEWGDLEKALEALTHLAPHRADNYDDWLKVAMALHSVDYDLFEAWDLWSMQSPKYGQTIEKWETLKADGGVTVATLIDMAYEDGKPKPSSFHALSVDYGAHGGYQYAPSKFRRNAAHNRYKGNQDELDDETLQYIKEELSGYLSESKMPLDIIHPYLLQEVRNLVSVCNYPLDIAIATLIVVCASCINPKTILKIGNEVITPNLWMGITGEACSGKTSMISIFTDPLIEIDLDHVDDYARAMEEYELQMSAWDKLPNENKSRDNKPVKPVARGHVTNKFTMEGLLNELIEQPDDGKLVFLDELSRLFKSMNMYRKGGDDRQLLSQLYNGKAFITQTKNDGKRTVRSTNVSIIGGIPLTELQSIYSKDESKEDGFWSRFDLLRFKRSMKPRKDEYPINGLLRRLYETIESLSPQQHKLSREALYLFNDFELFMFNELEKEDNPFLSAVIGRYPLKAAKASLILHLMDTAVENREPTPEIPADTVRRGVEFAKWLLSKTRSVYAEIGACTDDKNSEVLRFVSKFKGKGWIDTKRARAWFNKPKPPSQKVRDFMALVVRFGFAIDNGLSSTDPKYQIKVTNNAPPHNKDDRGDGGAPYIPNPCGHHPNGHYSNGHKHDLDGDITPHLPPVSDDDITLGNGGTLFNGKGLFSKYLKPYPMALGIDWEGKNGNGAAPLSLDRDSASSDRAIDHSQPIHLSNGKEGYSPYQAISYVSENTNGVTKTKILVDESKIDLDWVPERNNAPINVKVLSVKPWDELTRVYLDIETTGLDYQTSEIIMVGLGVDNKDGTFDYIPIQRDGGVDEKTMLETLFDCLKELRPHCLIGHNIFKFDLPFIKGRCEILGVACPFRFDDREIEIKRLDGYSYRPIHLDGVNILDTYINLALWDKMAAKLSTYKLKESVIELGLRDGDRLVLGAKEIKQLWESGDTETIKTYLKHDLEDTKLLADFLYPTMVELMAYVPGVSLQQIAIVGSSFLIQRIAEHYLPNVKGEPDERVDYDGGKVVSCGAGIFKNVAKVDVESLYPTIMLRYQLWSRKDSNKVFLKILEEMRRRRLELKQKAKNGDEKADREQAALKTLINAAYGYLASEKRFNDYETAALITAYGRKILDVMLQTIEEHGGKLIEADTDGIIFSSENPEAIYDAVQNALPEGFRIDLEYKGCSIYVSGKKNYIIIHPDGKITAKGVFRKRNRIPMETEFYRGFLEHYTKQSPEAAHRYYQEMREKIASGALPIEKLSITRKISKSEKTLVERGIGEVGDVVSFYYGDDPAKPNKTIPIQDGPYSVRYYTKLLDAIYDKMVGNDEGTSKRPCD